MAAPAWLTARPVAHRGLHDLASGVVENTVGAAEAAIARGFAIEIDVQETADGHALVFHDETLERLTTGRGAVAGRDLAGLCRLAYRDSRDPLQPLEAFLELVADRTPVIVEVKSHGGNGERFGRRVAEILASYEGRAAIMSFDPRVPIVARAVAPDLTRGLTAGGDRDVRSRRGALRALRWIAQSRPVFVAYCVDDLPSPFVKATSWALGIPVLAWTIRTPEQLRIASVHADQIIFEGFLP